MKYSFELDAVIFESTKQYLTNKIDNLKIQIKDASNFNWQAFTRAAKEFYDHLKKSEKEYQIVVEKMVSYGEISALYKDQTLNILGEMNEFPAKYKTRMKIIAGKFDIFNFASIDLTEIFDILDFNLEAVKKIGVAIICHLEQVRQKWEDFVIANDSKLANVFKVRMQCREFLKNKKISFEELVRHFSKLNIAIIDLQENYSNILHEKNTDPMEVLNNFYGMIKEADWLGTRDTLVTMIELTKKFVRQKNDNDHHLEEEFIKNLREQVAVVEALQNYSGNVKEAVSFLQDDNTAVSERQDYLVPIIQKLQSCVLIENSYYDQIKDKDLAKKLISLIGKAGLQIAEEENSSLPSMSKMEN